MKKLFDVFTVKSYVFIVKEDELFKAIKMIQNAKFVGRHTDVICVAKLGDEDKESDNWFVRINLTKKQWYAFLEDCKNKGYQLVIKDDPDSMYFTKK